MLYTILDIEVKKDDAPEFIELINKIMRSLIDDHSIKEICKIRIKNWFDHKWLNFSGKAVIPFNGIKVDSALEEKWEQKITVPPFHPNRVLSETFFRKRPSENKIFEKRLHRVKTSNDNLQNRITNYTDDGLFVWYSSNTKINQKGSLMIYRVKDEAVETFYSSLENKEGWKIIQTKGIGINELKRYAGIEVM